MNRDIVDFLSADKDHKAHPMLAATLQSVDSAVTDTEREKLLPILPRIAESTEMLPGLRQELELNVYLAIWIVRKAMPTKMSSLSRLICFELLGVASEAVSNTSVVSTRDAIDLADHLTESPEPIVRAAAYTAMAAGHLIGATVASIQAFTLIVPTMAVEAKQKAGEAESLPDMLTSVVDEYHRLAAN